MTPQERRAQIQQWVTIGIAAAGVLVAGLLAWQWIVPAVKTEQRAKKERKTAIASTGSYENQANELRREIHAGEASLTTGVLVALPPEVRWEREFNRLDLLAHTVGAQITGFTPSDTATPTQSSSSSSSNAQQAAVSLSVSCSLQGCIRFLGGLRGLVQVHHGHVQSHGPLWFVNSVSLNAAPAGQNLQMSVHGGVYLSPTPIKNSHAE